MKTKDDTIAKVKDSGLSVLKQVEASKSSKEEL